jgi:nucleotide-binding universal stress UspA family protein
MIMVGEPAAALERPLALAPVGDSRGAGGGLPAGVPSDARRAEATTMDEATTFGQRILIPLDGSAFADQALPYVRLLASPGAEVILLRARPGGAAAAEDRDAAHRRLAETADEMRRGVPDARVDVVVTSGDPAAAILQAAGQRRVDLVVLASRGHRAPAQRILGSVADQVAAATPCPIFIVRPSEPGGHPTTPEVRRVIVPLDGSAQEARALAAARTLAALRSAPLQLLTAIDPDAVVPPVAAVDAAVGRDELAAAEAEAQQMLEQAGARLLRAGQAVAWHVRQGPAAAVILATVAAGDVIVLGSRGGSGHGKWPLGSVAAQVLRYAPTPVLLLPAGPMERAPS